MSTLKKTNKKVSILSLNKANLTSPADWFSLKQSYKPFSEPENIQRMLRKIVVFEREQELYNGLLMKEDPFYRMGVPYSRWGKYVSNIASKKRDPKEAYIYWDGKCENNFLDIFISKITARKSYIKELEKYFFWRYENFRKLGDLFFMKGTDFYKVQTNERLADLFEKFISTCGRALSGFNVPYYCVVALGRMIESELEKIPDFFSSKKREREIYKILGMAGGETFVQMERKGFLKNLISIQKIYKKSGNWNDKNIQMIVFKQWYDFGSLVFTHSGSKNYTIDDYRKKFFKNLKVNAEAELKKIKTEEDKRYKNSGKFFSKFKKYPEFFRLIGWFGRMVTYRNRDAELYFVYFYHFRYLFDEIARRLEISNDDLFLLGNEEIIGGLKSKINAKEIITERKRKGFTVKSIGNSIKVLTGVKKEDWHEDKIKKNKAQSFIKGIIASEGKVIGRVKIIGDARRDGGKFEKGEILVTAMTKPEFVHLMKKAAAIITDEGGIVSHAAILARELKKPCIIGTKIATKVLKDGDLVEVDANKGVVKIIKKS